MNSYKVSCAIISIGIGFIVCLNNALALKTTWSTAALDAWLVALLIYVIFMILDCFGGPSVEGKFAVRIDKNGNIINKDELENFAKEMIGEVESDDTSEDEKVMPAMVMSLTDNKESEFPFAQIVAETDRLAKTETDIIIKDDTGRTAITVHGIIGSHIEISDEILEKIGDATDETN